VIILSSYSSCTIWNSFNIEIANKHPRRIKKEKLTKYHYTSGLCISVLIKKILQYSRTLRFCITIFQPLALYYITILIVFQELINCLFKNRKQFYLPLKNSYVISLDPHDLVILFFKFAKIAKPIDFELFCISSFTT